MTDIQNFLKMHNLTPAELNPSSGLGGALVTRFGDGRTDILTDGRTWVFIGYARFSLSFI